MNGHRFRDFLAVLAVLLLAVPGTPGADLPLEWTSVDINASDGSAQVDVDGSWVVKGKGNDIFNDGDQFQFVYRFLEGDGSITARILFQSTDTDGWAKAGVMLRETDAPGSPHLMVAMTPSAGVVMEWRSEADRWSADSGAPQYPRVLPLYLRVQRQGERFTGFVSQDGLVWTQVGATQRLQMGSEILAGLCVTSRRPDLASTARFDRIAVGSALVPAGPASLQALVRDGGALLVWDSVPNASGYHVYRRAPNDSRLARLTRQPLEGLSYVDGGLTNGLVYRYHVTAVVDGTEGVPSAVAAATPMVPIQGTFCGYTIGTVTPGRAKQEADGSITVQGSGWDIWNREDSFYLLATPSEGDMILTARVIAPPTNSAEWAKAGLMLRESLAPGARCVSFIVTPRGVMQLQRRLVSGGETMPDGAPTPLFPIYLRLVRRGDWVTAMFSLDGLFFEPAANPVRFDRLDRGLWAGLAVSANRDGSLCAARFDQVSVVFPLGLQNKEPSGPQP